MRAFVTHMQVECRLRWHMQVADVNKPDPCQPTVDQGSRRAGSTSSDQQSQLETLSFRTKTVSWCACSQCRGVFRGAHIKFVDLLAAQPLAVWLPFADRLPLDRRRRRRRRSLRTPVPKTRAAEHGTKTDSSCKHPFGMNY